MTEMLSEFAELAAKVYALSVWMSMTVPWFARIIQSAKTL